MFQHKPSYVPQQPTKPITLFRRTSDRQTEFQDKYLKRPLFLELPTDYNPEKLSTLREQICNVCVEAGREREKIRQQKKTATAPVIRQINMFEVLCPACSGIAVIDSDDDGEFIRCSCGFNERQEYSKQREVEF